MEDTINGIVEQTDGGGIIFVFVGLFLLLFFNWKINGSSGTKKRKEKIEESEKLHGSTIEKIIKTQKEIENDVKNDDEIVEEKKEAIGKIIKEHNNEIIEVLTSNDVKSTLKRIKEKWQNGL